ncbi:MAG: hypothetical protein WAK90_04135 [Pseudolabrys sp.]
MRQKRDKTGLGPEYKHIPRDAAGVPIFLILPDGVRESYEDKMATCRAGWMATGDPLFVAEACTLAMIHRQPMPAWLDEAVYAVATQRRTKAHAKAAREAAARFERYCAVRDAHALDGLSWESARSRAAEALAETPAAVTAETCWQSYKSVRRDLRADRGGLYANPKEQNRKPPATGVRRKARTQP